LDWLIRLATLILSFVCCQQVTYNNDALKTNARNKTYNNNNLVEQAKQKNTLLTSVESIPAPKGYSRKMTTGFGKYLRNLKLKENKKVFLFNGKPKANQKAQYAVIDLDVGNRDLQQCADAVMRLRAEYMFHNNQQDEIQFNFTSGDKCSWKYWKAGYRPIIKGNKVDFKKNAQPNPSYTNFKKYLTTIFIYAGTSSLSKELKKKTVNKIAIGDVFIQGGFPGHAVIVVDVAENEVGEQMFLLAQSYMPAQDIHVLVNANNRKISPWYSLTDLKKTKKLSTPEWTFYAKDLYIF